MIPLSPSSRLNFPLALVGTSASAEEDFFPSPKSAPELDSRPASSDLRSDPSDSIQVYILEDNPGLRHTLGAVVEAMPDMDVCGDAENAEDALQALKEIPCDVVLVDLSLPGMDGIEFIRHASAFCRAKFLVLTGHRSPRLADLVTEAGGHGFLLKDGPAEVFAAIREVVGLDRFAF
jgi:CheY-like chemotaxis protein